MVLLEMAILDKYWRLLEEPCFDAMGEADDLKNSVNDGKDLELEVSKFFNSSRAALAKMSILIVEDNFLINGGLSEGSWA